MLRRNSSLFNKRQNNQNIDLPSLLELLKQCEEKKVFDIELFRLIVSSMKAFISKDEDSSPQDVETIIRILVLLKDNNFIDKNLVQIVADYIENSEAYLSPPQVDDLLQVLKTVQLNHKEVLRMCEHFFVYEIQEFEFDTLCRVFRNYASLVQHHDLEVCQMFLQQFKQQQQLANFQFTQQNIADAVEGLQNFRYFSESFLRATSEWLQQQENEIDIHIFERVIRNMSKLGFFDTDLYDFAVDKCMHTKNPLQVPFLCNLLWSMGIGDYWPEELWEKLVSLLQQSEAAWGDLTEIQVKKLFQCSLLMDFESRQSFWEPIPFKLKQYARHLHISSLDSKGSYVQNQIWKCLKRLGYKCEIEKLIENETFVVDIYSSVDQLKIAFEVDGPEHFTGNRPYLPVGKTLARNRLLQNQGYQVVMLPFYEYEYHYKSKEQLMKYLEQKLTDEVVQVAQLS
eukprot:TRINITY_DN11035_c0_g1_i2.p1 TRINITY_DN11035_c0_g1~~TRINITY_DN11035_c0_g1_i2.p1  ORF type:complete len:454 (-),score=47.56 TRINITY_DN11035_c0_g1_i2:110-1471(-)